MNDAAQTMTGSTSTDRNSTRQQQITRVGSSVKCHTYYNDKIKYKLTDEAGDGAGRTEQVLKDVRSRTKYIYHDSLNNEHKIGTYDVIVTGDTYADSRYKDKLGGNMIYLIDISDNISSYSDGDVQLELAINTERPYANDVTTASLLGAMLSTGCTDLNYNGGSSEKGMSPASSSSHKSGMNLSMRYLRRGQPGNGIYLGSDGEIGGPCGQKGLDVERRDKFIEELNRFGWNTILGWKCRDSTNSPNTGHAWDRWYVVQQCEHPGKIERPVLKNITHAINHNHHTHFQGYNPTLKLMVN